MYFTLLNGITVGEMEMQCITAHGMASFLKEKSFDLSDKYEVYICDKCGLIAEYNEELRFVRCKGCPDNKNDFSKINMGYSTKLLFNELLPLSFIPRIKTV